ncbi:hypothetical protein GJ496_002769 [Pomphorhynchus laevis]|nr:hypothetical protein GJ496_002769 [Pomphorhynchus laevis]
MEVTVTYAPTNKNIDEKLTCVLETWIRLANPRLAKYVISAAVGEVEQDILSIGQFSQLSSFYCGYKVEKQISKEFVKPAPKAKKAVSPKKINEAAHLDVLIL